MPVSGISLQHPNKKNNPMAKILTSLDGLPF